MPAPVWFAGIGGELRAAIGDEFRREAAAEELAVAKHRVRSRDLTDVAVELMHQGAAVTFSWEHGRAAGWVIHAANDLATLATRGGGTVHFSLDTSVTMQRRSGERSRRGRNRDPMACESFGAQLRELELQDSRVRLETAGPASGVSGRIKAVASDHIVFDSPGATWFVPRRSIWAVWDEPEPGHAAGQGVPGSAR